MQEREETWFLAQLKPNAAKVAERNLLRQGFRTLLPKVEETRKRRGAFVTAERPLFPGYVFVAFDVDSGAWRSINATVGITRLVSFGRAPAPVPADLMAHLLERCGPSGVLEAPTLPQPGDRVRVTKGPFAEFVAEIESIEPDRRVWVLLEFMGGQARVSVGPDQLRAV